MPRIPRTAMGALGGAAMGAPGAQALDLGIPAVRKPTRGALGGAAPRGARQRMPPTVAASGQRGGVKKKAVTPKRKASKK